MIGRVFVQSDGAFIAEARTRWPAALSALEEAGNLIAKQALTTIDAMERIDALKAEVARLTALLAGHEQMVKGSLVVRDKARAENARLKEALEFYASEDIYSTPSIGNSAFYEAEIDAGKRARAALDAAGKV